MLNRSEFIGNIGRKPEIKTFSDGGKIAQFSIAITEKGYTTQSGIVIQDRTTWVNIVAKGRLVEVFEKYTDKGSKIYVAGKLTNRQYEKDGVTHHVTEIVASEVELLGGGEKSAQSSAEPQNSGISQPDNTDKGIEAWANGANGVNSGANSGEMPF